MLADRSRLGWLPFYSMVLIAVWLGLFIFGHWTLTVFRSLGWSAPEVSALGDLVSALAGVLTLMVAWAGLRTWERQILAQHNVPLARAAIASLSAVGAEARRLAMLSSLELRRATSKLDQAVSEWTSAERQLSVAVPIAERERWSQLHQEFRDSFSSVYQGLSSSPGPYSFTELLRFSLAEEKCAAFLHDAVSWEYRPAMPS
jgi:hypothetical protein